METRIKLHDTIEKLLAVVLDLPEDGLVSAIFDRESWLSIQGFIFIRV